MSENRDSVDARRIPSPAYREPGSVNPGDFAWEFDFTHFEHGAKETDLDLTLYICLPGERMWSPIHVRRGPTPASDRVWGWDGNFDKPTVTPSIHHPGLWHGYLTAGRFQSV